MLIKLLTGNMLQRLILNPLVDLISGLYIRSMIAYSSSNLPNDDYSMKPENFLFDSTLDLLSDKADAEAFAMDIEEKASALEITVDYYMQEFM